MLRRERVLVLMLYDENPATGFQVFPKLWSEVNSHCFTLYFMFSSLSAYLVPTTIYLSSGAHGVADRTLAIVKL